MKDIKNYEGLYAITEKGEVWSYKSNKFLKQGISNNRPFVSLSKNNEVKRYFVYRLVAQAFIPNPDNLPQVNHKDENTLNSYVDNLEWCDAKYNNNYGTHKQRMIKGLTGRKLTEQHRQNIAEAKKAYWAQRRIQ